MSRNVLEMQLGESAVIEQINDHSVACRLLTIGVLPETRLTLVRFSPWANSLCIKLGETVIAIRKKEAEAINVL